MGLVLFSFLFVRHVTDVLNAAFFIRPDDLELDDLGGRGSQLVPWTTLVPQKWSTGVTKALTRNYARCHERPGFGPNLRRRVAQMQHTPDRKEHTHRSRYLHQVRGFFYFILRIRFACAGKHSQTQ